MTPANASAQALQSAHRTKWWASDQNALLNGLGSDPVRGLSDSEAESRLAQHGSNRLAAEKAKHWTARLLGQYKSPVVLTLLAATVISAVLGEWVDAVAIAAIVVINSLIGFFQESKAEAAVEALKKLSVPKCRVIRSGVVSEISAERIVPGDLLVFEAGDLIAADARVIESNQLSVDEAVLTGESLPVQKQVQVVAEDAALGDRVNSLFAGTAVANGSGRALVLQTGMGTEIGRIAGMLKAAEVQDTPLQQRLAQVSTKLLLFSLVVVVLVGVLGALHGESALTVLMSAISLAVAAIPEGLPTVVTLALALAVHRMTKRNAIVRHLPAVETLGSTTVICTDKTGTLTTGKMRAREAFILGQDVRKIEDLRGSPVFQELSRAAVLCSNAAVSEDGQASGDPTEVALLLAAKDSGLLIHEIHAAGVRLREWPFDSDRKRMSVAIQEKASGRKRVVVKGAPEAVVPLCRLSTQEVSNIQSALERLSSQGRRILAVAERILAEDANLPDGMADSEKDLSFLGLVSIADPPRIESMDAIRRCKAAGIKVVMITGDHPATAQAIARELGITDPGSFDGVLSGPELARLTFEELVGRVRQTAVYARVSPEHKLQIVRAWKSLGEVVSMTGDGVNDAPALKEASIGVAMGKGGTEVARQASSMVLSDDNFATITAAVEEGRAIYGNIRRTIQYLLSGNLAEILIMLGAALAGWPAPLAPIHLLWINLVTDGLPSLALAAEPVPKDVLGSTERPSPKSFLDRAFYSEIGFVGSVTAVLALGVYAYSLKYEDEATARTHIFSFLVFAELFRSFACRSESRTYFELSPWTNVYHLVAVAIPLAFQITLHHTTFFQEVFKVQPISWTECAVFLALTLVPVTLVELRKIILQRKKATP